MLPRPSILLTVVAALMTNVPHGLLAEPVQATPPEQEVESPLTVDRAIGGATKVSVVTAMIDSPSGAGPD